MVRWMIAAAAMLSGGCVTNVGGAAPRPLSSSFAAASDEQIIAHIRELEERARRAVLAGDVASLEALWDPAFLVNAPNSRLLVGRESLDLVRSGVIHYTRFDRVIERVEVDGDTAVAMGSETVVQQRGPPAGQVIQRRYTNIWRMKNGRWLLRFRHANVVPPQQVSEPRRP